MVPPELLCDVRWDVAETTVALCGELDLACAEDLRAASRQVAADPGGRPVLVDLRGVDFVDSCAVRIITALRRELGEVGRPVRVLGARRSEVRRAFELVERLAANP